MVAVVKEREGGRGRERKSGVRGERATNKGEEERGGEIEGRERGGKKKRQKCHWKQRQIKMFAHTNRDDWICNMHTRTYVPTFHQSSVIITANDNMWTLQSRRHSS